MDQEKEIILNVEERKQIGKKISKKLNREGKFPAVVYGKKFKNVNLVADSLEFEKIRREQSENVIISLTFPDKKVVKVIVHDVYLHPVRGDVRHVDFLKIDLKIKVHTEVPIKFIGISAAVKDQGGVLVKNMDEIKVNCLPTEIPEYIEADISKIENIDEHIEIKDLIIDSKVEVLDKPDSVVAIVTIKKKEEIEEPVKAEGEEGEEGEAESSEEGEAKTDGVSEGGGESKEGEDKKDSGDAK